MTPVTPFSAALRERSSNAHSGSEHAGFMSDLMKGEGTREDYIALVAQHWFMYDAIERAAEVMAARLPRAEVVTVSGAGHIVNIEAPEAFDAALVAFLEKLRAQGA